MVFIFDQARDCDRESVCIIEVKANQLEVIRIMDYISPPMGLSFKFCACSHIVNLMQYSEDQNISPFRRHFPIALFSQPHPHRTHDVPQVI